jgi:hypothetical protein
MAAINFPDSPTNGDTHTENNKTWVYDGTQGKWNVQSQAIFTIYDSDGSTPLVQFAGLAVI